MKLGGGDPGKHRDSFFVVRTEVPDDRDRLQIKAAKRWTGQLYLEVEKQMALAHSKSPFDHFALEINNTGTHVYEVLRNIYHLPVIPVTTTKDIKDPQKKYNIQKMDKNETVRETIHWLQDGIIQLPSKLTADLHELKRQMSIFAEVKTEAGSVSYRAEGSEHDDGVMALLLNVHLARRIIRTRNMPYQVYNRKYTPSAADVYGSAVPNGGILRNKEIYMP